jgi:hypothetical protein
MYAGAVQPLLRSSPAQAGGLGKVGRDGGGGGGGPGQDTLAEAALGGAGLKGCRPGPSNWVCQCTQTQQAYNVALLRCVRLDWCELT